VVQADHRQFLFGGPLRIFSGPPFLSVATGRSQWTIVLPASCNSCLSVVVCSLSVTDENWNFSAVHNPIGLKLSGDLGLVSQISVHVLVSRFVYFFIVNKKKDKKTPKSQKSRFYKACVFSAVPSPIDLKLGGNIWTSTRNSVVCLFCLYYCLFTFRKHKQRKHTLWISRPSLHQMF
jgi:hypothetical protein